MKEIYLEGDMIPGGGGKSDFFCTEVFKGPCFNLSCAKVVSLFNAKLQRHTQSSLKSRCLHPTVCFFCCFCHCFPAKVELVLLTMPPGYLWPVFSDGTLRIESSVGPIFIHFAWRLICICCCFFKCYAEHYLFFQVYVMYKNKYMVSFYIKINRFQD